MHQSRIASLRAVATIALPCPPRAGVVSSFSPSAAAARVRLDDGSEVEAEIIRTEIVEDDYFIAFTRGDREVTAVIALDDRGEVLTWSKTSRGPARFSGSPLGLERRTAQDSDGGSH
jgi:hypothetical protein